MFFETHVMEEFIFSTVKTMFAVNSLTQLGHHVLWWSIPQTNKWIPGWKMSLKIWNTKFGTILYVEAFLGTTVFRIFFKFFHVWLIINLKILKSVLFHMKKRHMSDQSYCRFDLRINDYTVQIWHFGGTEKLSPGMFFNFSESGMNYGSYFLIS